MIFATVHDVVMTLLHGIFSELSDRRDHVDVGMSKPAMQNASADSAAIDPAWS